jgi:aspartate aminotransferase
LPIEAAAYAAFEGVLGQDRVFRAATPRNDEDEMKEQMETRRDGSRGPAQERSSLQASRLGAIGFSQTLAMGRRAADLRRAGRDIISLGMGELDLDIPLPVREAAAKAALRGDGRSPPVEGLQALREGIARKLLRDNGVNCPADGIIVSSGTKQVIFNAMMATLDPGDEVLIPAPYWVSYPDIVRLAGGTPVILTCGADRGHKLSPEQLEEAITAHTRWLILNSPNNPTGVVYSREELAALAGVLARFPQVMVLSDEIYELFTFTAEGFTSLASVAPGLKDRILLVNGLSKSFAMIGWRIGYGAGPAELISAMVKVQSQNTSGVATIVQAGAIAAMDMPLEALQPFRTAFARRKAKVAELLHHIPDFRAVQPEGAFYFYPMCESLIGRRTAQGGTIGSDADLAEFLLDTADIVTVPGSAFGLGPALRLSYTCPEERLEEAFQRIGASLASLC